MPIFSNKPVKWCCTQCSWDSGGIDQRSDVRWYSEQSVCPECESSLEAKPLSLGETLVRGLFG